MAIRSSQFFTYNGISSLEFGISNVNISSGMLEEPFMAQREINEVKIRGRDKPYFVGVTNSPLSFTLNFAFNDDFDSSKLRAVARWLTTDFYKPLIFSDNMEKIYYAMLDGDTNLIHTGADQGYITLTMRCDSPYAYSPSTMSPTYDLSNNTSNGTTIQFNNMGDLQIAPEIWIKKIGNGDVSITNLSNNGEVFSFTGLSNNETVYVDCANEFISSDIVPAVYRYSNFNNNFLNLPFGVSNLVVTGKCQIRFRYQFIYLQG